MKKYENEFSKLWDNMTAKEFYTQLIMFEKSLSREQARAKAIEFMEHENIISIFEMQILFEEV